MFSLSQTKCFCYKFFFTIIDNLKARVKIVPFSKKKIFQININIVSKILCQIQEFNNCE